MDVKDAYLEVPQEEPVVADLPKVDDGLMLAPLTWLKQKYIPTLQSRFEISVGLLSTC